MADGAAKGRRRPLYARLLRLHRLRPGPVLCFIFLEGAIALGVLLALANLASWWTVLALPAAVALMVKLNDIVAGATARKPPVPKVAPRPAEKKIEKPDWPLQGNPSKPLIEDAQDDEDEDEDEDEEEDTEKTEPPEATRSESDESVTRPAS
jgi:hypothetical protein